MELDAYLRALVRRWYIPLLLLAVAVGSVWTYNTATRTNTAEATVALLFQLRISPGEFQTTQIGFDVLDESQELPERVASRLDDGTLPEDLEGKISVGIKARASQASSTLLYSVSAKDRDEDRAVLLANIAVEEARALFAELNSPQAKDVRAAFTSEVNRAEGEVASARELLNQFLVENDAYGLAQRLDLQVGLVSQLRLLSQSMGTGSTVGGSPGGSSLAEARAELQRLVALEPEHSRIAFEVNLAGAAVARLETQLSALRVAGSDPTAIAEAEGQLARAQERLASAQGDLSRFQTAHSVSSLTAGIQTQLAMVNQLVVSEAAGATSAVAIQEAAAAEEAELQRLAGLETRYSQLGEELDQAEIQLVRLENRILNIIVGQSLPAEVQIHVLEDAQIQSNLWWTAITYALGVLLALFFSFTAVYVLAFYEKAPPTVRELERRLGQPVIARVPRAAR